MEIDRSLMVPASIVKARSYSGTNGRTHITVHQTGNTNPGANARAHALLQYRGNSRSASWHYTVDANGVYQSFEDTVRCWHSGKGRDTGNLNSIAIEICVDDLSESGYIAALRNAAELIRILCARHNIPIGNVVQHNRWSGKNCPTQIRAAYHGVGWNAFIGWVGSGSPSIPSSPVTGRPKLAEDGALGPATIREGQYQAGTYPDGVIDKVSPFVRALQVRLNNAGARDWNGWTLAPDGVGLQQNTKYRYPRFGRTRTIWALQNYLKKIGYLPASFKPDGYLSARDSLTVRAFQKALNDGKMF